MRVLCKLYCEMLALFCTNVRAHYNTIIMDALLTQLGLTSNELIQIVILAVVLLVGLFIARVAFKLTATLLRIGCFGILFIVAAVFVLNLLN